MKEAIGEEVAKVRLSRKLASRPCCLTSEGPLTLEMERYFRNGPSEEMRKLRATRVLELNPEHPAFAAVKAAFEGDQEKGRKLAKILWVLAEMNAGVEVEDTGEFTELVSGLF